MTRILQPMAPNWPTTWPGWVGFFITLVTVIGGTMGVGAKVLGLDTISAREHAIDEVTENQSRNTARIENIEKIALCIIWEVDPDKCSVRRPDLVP